MSRRRRLGTKNKIALLVGAAAVAGGGAFAMASTSNAAQSPGPKTLSAADSNVCQGLATALGNNQKFIDGQKAAPDAQSAARIANREAVIEQIKVQQKASGCTVGESAQGSQATQPTQSAQNGAGQQAGGAQQSAQPSQAASQPAGNAGGAAASGQQVCNGSTVTLSGEGGAPAA